MPVNSVQVKREGIWVDAKLYRIRDLEVENEQLKARIEALTTKPDFVAGQKVKVDHPRYHGTGEVTWVDAPRGAFVHVLLENGNTWAYEAETVTPE